VPQDGPVVFVANVRESQQRHQVFLPDDDGVRSREHEA
jgi:hypothetical protein